MKTTAGKCVLVAAVVVLGLFKIPLLPAIVLFAITAGTVHAFERLFGKHDELPRH